MTNKLAAKLAALPPNESDAELKRVWDAFRGTEFHEAVDILLSHCEDQIDAHLLHLDTPAEKRNFLAGERAMLKILRATITACMTLQLGDTPPTEPSIVLPEGAGEEP